MADGEINVSVRADGVDDAAGELGGEGSEADASRQQSAGAGGGNMQKILVRIAALLAFLGPIFDVLGTVAKVMEAFVAPLAIILMRMLRPVLRLMVQILPIWWDIFSTIDRFNAKFGNMSLGLMLIVGILRGVHTVVGFIGGVLEGVRDLLGEARDWLADIFDGLRELPSNIADRLPSAGDVGGRARDGISDALLGGDDSRRRQAVNIGIGGGLEPFIDRLTRDGSVDFP